MIPLFTPVCLNQTLPFPTTHLFIIITCLKAPLEPINGHLYPLKRSRKLPYLGGAKPQVHVLPKVREGISLLLLLALEHLNRSAAVFEEVKPVPRPEGGQEKCAHCVLSDQEGLEELIQSERP